MHIVLAVLGIAAGIYFWVIRARNAAEMTSELMDVASDVRAAARRLGFRRKNNVHPVESTDDPKVLAAVVALSYLEQDGLPSAETLGTLKSAMSRELTLTMTEADEFLILARWLMGECQGPQPAIARAARRMVKTGAAADTLAPMMAVIKAVTAPEGPSPRQADSLSDIKAAFKIR